MEVARLRVLAQGLVINFTEDDILRGKFQRTFDAGARARQRNTSWQLCPPAAANSTTSWCKDTQETPWRMASVGG